VRIDGAGTSFAMGLPQSRSTASSEKDMGKYFVGWLLGIPLVVLLLAWFFFR
jgi:hypothetical protein